MNSNWLARIGAFALFGLALTAQAQSSNVTLFGTIDLGVGSFKSLGVGVSAANESIKQVVNGGMTTSVWGIRGSEDLGGGLSANFELASFFRADTGAVGRSDAVGPPVNVAADPFWSRQAWIGLTGAQFGRLRLGNTTSQLFFNSITSNAFGDSTVISPLNVVTFIGSPLSGGTGWTNQVVYDTPRLGGFTFGAAVSASEGQGGRNAGWRVAYADGPLSVSLAGQDVKRNPLTFADGTSPNNTKAWQVAGSYDFKVVKVCAHLGEIQNDGTETTPLDITYRLWEVSAAIPIGNGRLLAAYARRKTGDAVSPVPGTAAGGNVERKVFTLGYDYDLSKRTDLYAAIMSDETVTRTLPAPGGNVSASATNYVLGLRHRF
jgi:predicted porin